MRDISAPTVPRGLLETLPVSSISRPSLSSKKRGRERRLIVEDGFVRVNPWRGRGDNPIEMTQRGGCLVVLLTRD